MGFVGLWLLRLVIPTAPVYTALVFALITLILTLRFIAQRFSWLIPWYYILPAIVFLLAFTLFPVILTVILAFTNYAGTRNCELDVSSKTAITHIEGTTLELANIKELRCDWLLTPSQEIANKQGSSNRTGCENVRAVLYSSGMVEGVGDSLEGTTLKLVAGLEPNTSINSVELFIPDFGFAQEIKVLSNTGKTIELERPPAGTPELDNIRISLTGSTIERDIIRVEGNTLTLDSPLPADSNFSEIARYNKFQYVGLDQFRSIMREARKALLPVFAWNLSFSILTVIINTVIGVFLALLLNNPDLRFRNLYRTLLIIPWALPGIITIQVWRGFLNTNFGAVNRFLALLDLPVFDWLGDCTLAKGAVLLVNLWLGLPFMITATLGALSAIPRELYEASRMDGANPWQSFWGVTAPLLRTALVPITLTGFAFNFNNFNIIYLLTDGGPPASWGTSTARCTDILISWAYNEAFRSQGGYAYGLGAAISLIIFIITLAVSLMNFRVTGALKEEGVR